MNTTTNQASGVAEPDDDSLLLCVSDLQHSAIYDNHVEMQACMRAVADRIAALATKPAAPAEVVAAQIYDLVTHHYDSTYSYSSEFVGGQKLAHEQHRERGIAKVVAALRTPTQAPSTGAVTEGVKIWLTRDPSTGEVLRADGPPVVQPASPTSRWILEVKIGGVWIPQPPARNRKAEAEKDLEKSDWRHKRIVPCDFNSVHPASPAVEVASKRVPLEPTKEMIDAGLSDDVAVERGDVTAIYAAMLGAAPAAASSTEPASDADGARYHKLRGWMSSNVTEGWTEVERMGAVAAWMSWEDMDRYLDALPVCNVGLMQTSSPTPTPAVAVPGSLTEDVRRARAFGECLKDCDKHAIQTDTASAFLWGWRAATTSTAAQPGEAS